MPPSFASKFLIMTCDLKTARETEPLRNLGSVARVLQDGAAGVSKFQPLSEYGRDLDAGYKLLPLRFTPLDADRYVLTNFVGEYHVLERDGVARLCPAPPIAQVGPPIRTLSRNISSLDADFNVALDLLALKTRTKYERLANFTALHMFVVSLRCEHSCPYCQVSRQSDDKRQFDMTEETAEPRARPGLPIAVTSIKIEFQGGEPLLNFPLIEYVVREALARNATGARTLGS